MLNKEKIKEGMERFGEKRSVKCGSSGIWGQI